MADAPEDIVRQFCAAWRSADPDALLAFMTNDAVFHNVPMDPLVGEEALRAAFQAYFLAASNFHFEILHMASSENVVFVERLDHFDIGDAHVELPCNGVFEIVHGRIAVWRDYFDEATIGKQLMPGVGSG